MWLLICINANSERLYTPSPALPPPPPHPTLPPPGLSNIQAVPPDLAQANWRGFRFSALHGLLVTTWHFGAIKKKQSRSIDLGKELAAVKTGKSMVSVEKRVRYTSTQQFLSDKRPAVEQRAEWLAIYWKLYAAGCVSAAHWEEIVYVAVSFLLLLVIV